MCGVMELVVRPSAESDLEGIKEKNDVERILKKLSDIEDRLQLGVEPETGIEKWLSGNWSPMPQQRLGDYRLWFQTTELKLFSQIKVYGKTNTKS